jgi:hypothetical protein
VGVLLLNLVAAHVYRFAFTWRKSGIQLAHIGLILLLAGELLSGVWQTDYAMRLAEGQTRNYSESFREHELAVIDATDAQFVEVVAIPEALLAKKNSIQHPVLPFPLTPRAHYPNSVLQPKRDGTPAVSPGAPQATAGFGERIVAAPQPITYRSDEINLPTSFVEINAPDRSLGTWLVSAHLVMPEEFEYGGKKWKSSSAPHGFTTTSRSSSSRSPTTFIPAPRSRKTSPAGCTSRHPTAAATVTCSST